MSERILIDLVTRIEGHARITVHLDDTGRVSDAHFHVTAFRGFERMFEGRPLLVIFVDALAGSGGGALELGSVAADGGAGWNTHAVEPPALLALTRAVHGRIPEAWLLTVPGRNFDIGEGLSPTAEEGVRQATDYISRLIQAKA